MIKKLKSYWGGKSVKQRICIVFVITAMLTMLFFTVKINFFDNPITVSSPVVTIGESSDTNETDEEAADELPPFHISIIDAGILLGVIGAYCVHKYREKKKQGRI